MTQSLDAGPSASAKQPPMIVTQGRLPDFFIVGNPKSGTTALYEMLRTHPDLYMPDLKETRFFARELHPGMAESSAHPQTLSEYISLFSAAGANQRIGEASPSYLRSRMAAGRIAEVRPDARIIAILREPASFLQSLHLELLRDHVETETDLRKALAQAPARSSEAQRLSQPGLVYPEYVRYVEQLRRYHSVFPREQILVLIYDDFRADNEATLRRVLRFLDVDDALPVQITEANPSVRIRSPRLYGAVRSLYLGRGPVARTLNRSIVSLSPRRVRRAALRTLQRRVLYGRPVPADEDLVVELRRRFKPEVVALSEYLGRDLVTLWGYERIG
jgi:Sulfotransferase family